MGRRDMQRWQAQRITHPLTAAQLIDNNHGNRQNGTAGEDARAPAGAGQPATRSAGPQAPGGQRMAPSDEQELARIREILVGPQLRDHERRLRLVERLSAEAPTHGVPAEWRAQIDAAFDRERQMRDEQALAQSRAMAQLSGELQREREAREAQAQALETMRAEQEQMAAQLRDERHQREEVASVHARAIAALAKELDNERQAHLRLHAHHATELDARLERERRAYAEELRRVQRSHGVQDDSLYHLVEEARQALVAMRAERDYLAGLLAELGMHLVRHAASPAAAQAERTAESFLGASADIHYAPGI